MTIEQHHAKRSEVLAVCAVCGKPIEYVNRIGSKYAPYWRHISDWKQDRRR